MLIPPLLLIETIEEKSFYTARADCHCHNHCDSGKVLRGHTLFHKFRHRACYCGCSAVRHLRFVLQRAYDRKTYCREGNAQRAYKRHDAERDTEPRQYGERGGSGNNFFDFRLVYAQLLCAFHRREHIIKTQCDDERKHYAVKSEHNGVVEMKLVRTQNRCKHILLLFQTNI